MSHRVALYNIRRSPRAADRDCEGGAEDRAEQQQVYGAEPFLKETSSSLSTGPLTAISRTVPIPRT